MLWNYFILNFILKCHKNRLIITVGVTQVYRNESIKFFDNLFGISIKTGKQ